MVSSIKNVNIQIVLMDFGHMVRLVMMLTIFLGMVVQIAKLIKVTHVQILLWNLLYALNAWTIVFSVIWVQIAFNVRMDFTYRIKSVKYVMKNVRLVHLILFVRIVNISNWIINVLFAMKKLDTILIKNKILALQFVEIIY